MVLVNLSVAEQWSIDLTISTSGLLVNLSTYELLASMTTLAPSNVATTDVTTDVESDDDEEISDEEMTHSYKIMYEKLVETVNENRGLLKQISQLCREKNGLIKQVNVLKN